MARKNKDKDRDDEDRPKAPPPPSPKKEDKKEVAAAAPVTYAGGSGQKFFLWAGLLLVVAGYVSSHRGKSDSSGSGSKASGIVMCGGLPRPELSRNSSPVSQKVSRGCFSGVIVAPSTPKDKIVWHAPGKVDVCFWRVNRCVAWMHIGKNEIQEAVRKGDPEGGGQVQIPDDYTALFFRGDPGDLEVLLSR